MKSKRGKQAGATPANNAGAARQGQGAGLQHPTWQPHSSTATQGHVLPCLGTARSLERQLELHARRARHASWWVRRAGGLRQAKGGCARANPHVRALNLSTGCDPHALGSSAVVTYSSSSSSGNKTGTG